MQKHPNHLEHLANIREVLAPAIRSGIKIMTEDGRAVTFDNLDTLVMDGAAIKMTGTNGEVLAVVLSDDIRPSSPRRHETLPSFSQIMDDGERLNFWLPETYARGPLKGASHATLYAEIPFSRPNLDEQGKLARLKLQRFNRIFEIG